MRWYEVAGLRIENPRVGGSNPPPGTNLFNELRVGSASHCLVFVSAFANLARPVHKAAVVPDAAVVALLKQGVQVSLVGLD